MKKPEQDQDMKAQKLEIRFAQNVNPNARAVYNYNGIEGRFVPLQVTRIINLLSNPNILPDEAESIDTLPFDIEEKIHFNSLKRWADIVHEFGFYSSDVDNIYREFDRQGLSKSTDVFRWLKFELYSRMRSQYSGDELFDKIFDQVIYLVKNDPDYKVEIGQESLTVNAWIVLVHAFMKCKIFEKPIPKC